MSEKDKANSLKCKCKHNGVQDALHVVYECTATKDAISLALDTIEKSMNTSNPEVKNMFQKLNQKDQITYSLSGLRKTNTTSKPTRVQEKIVVQAWSKAYGSINAMLDTF